ncbi:MAG TPA: DUF998 domain-containing protein [Flavitalea sp.]|nr:DUF998 domain-containing protein [Flavitalea sp.]
MKTRIKACLIGGIWGSLSFVILFLAQGAIRPQYNPFRHPVSSLSIGHSGWVQIINFIFTGSLIVAFSVGLNKSSHVLDRSVWIPRLIGLAGVGLIGAGIFVSDPVYGYPSTVPFHVRQYTIHGHLHDLFSLFFFICLPIACFKSYARFLLMDKKVSALCALIFGLSMCVAFICASIGFKQVKSFVSIAGMFQRLAITLGLGWIVVLGVGVLISARKT